MISVGLGLGPVFSRQTVTKTGRRLLGIFLPDQDPDRRSGTPLPSMFARLGVRFMVRSWLLWPSKMRLYDSTLMLWGYIVNRKFKNAFINLLSECYWDPHVLQYFRKSLGLTAGILYHNYLIHLLLFIISRTKANVFFEFGYLVVFF